MPSAANPMTYALPAVVLAAVVVYFLYGALDRLGLASERTTARVTGKQIAAGSTTYHTSVVAGRSWTQSSTNPDAPIVSLEVNGVATGGVVTPELYQALQPGDTVQVTFTRTRFSRQILVTDVRR